MATIEEFNLKLKDQQRPLVVDFWAPWCMPCRSMEPTLKRVEQQYEGTVDVWRVNADEAPEVMKALKIYGIPTTAAYRDGQEVARRTGALPQAELEGLFEAALTGEKPLRKGLSANERILRLVAGLLLVAFGWAAGPSWVLLALGGVIIFSGVYDRCPLWQAVAPRVAKLFQGASQ